MADDIGTIRQFGENAARVDTFRNKLESGMRSNGGKVFDIAGLQIVQNEDSVSLIQ